MVNSHMGSKKHKQILQFLQIIIYYSIVTPQSHSSMGLLGIIRHIVSLKEVKSPNYSYCMVTMVTTGIVTLTRKITIASVVKGRLQTATKVVSNL